MGCQQDQTPCRRRGEHREVLKQNLEGHLHTYKYIQTEVEALLKHVLNQGWSYFKGC